MDISLNCGKITKIGGDIDAETVCSHCDISENVNAKHCFYGNATKTFVKFAEELLIEQDMNINL